MTPLLVLLAAACGAAAVLALLLRRARRETFIRTQPLPPGLHAALQARHPGLSRKDCELVERGLRQFFLAYLQGGRRPVTMPSQVADDLWHAFILHTRAYADFCRRAFGGFLHHAPAAVPGQAAASDAGLKRVWRRCCAEENIDPDRPSRMPLLFALDAKFGIAGGFVYALDCRAAPADGGGGGAHCATAFADGGGSSGGDGDGDGGGGGCGGD